MPKVVILQQLTEEQAGKVREAAPAWEIVFGKNKEDWLPHLPEATVICGWNKLIEEHCLHEGTALKWIHNWGAGVDRIPLALLAECGVVLTNSSGVHPNPISETVFAMMLAFTRMLHTYVRQQTKREWHHAGLRSELHGATIGIVGVGAIGLEVARLAKAFRMRVLGMRRSGEALPEVDVMYGQDRDGLAEMLGQSDYVVVTVPLTKETHHMFGREQFAQMKANAFFVNIGRGKTVDTEALMEALKSEQIAGAGLDVFEQEPLPADHPLWDMENVIITPHSSGSTVHYHERALGIFVQNLQKVAAGGEPELNRVSFDLQY
jgi:phosphoglycerate dehydrogenase-like enzyme